MAICQCVGPSGAVLGLLLLAGCSTSPFDSPPVQTQSIFHRLSIPTDNAEPGSIYRTAANDEPSSSMVVDGSPESYIRYALFHSPAVERSYQQWRVASERLPQVRALPDPRLNIGFFLDEVETRVGPQQAKVGIQQTFPWIGKLQDRQDAAAKGAMAAWYKYQETQLIVVERVLIALENIAYLDKAIAITKENYALLESFEEVVRARYRVGMGSHPELIRAQVELGQLEDRIIGLEALRPSYVANLNAVLNRDPEGEVLAGLKLPNTVASQDAKQITKIAQEWSPVLQSTIQRIEQARIKTEIARKDGKPDLTVGIEYIVTDEAANPTIAESGDDPIMLTFGINLPIWREKYDAGVRESIAQRLSISREFDGQTNALSAQIYQAWFEHTDADRRVRLYEDSLIPKAQESLSASLGGFRTGDSEFLDLLDTQRTLLEFAIAGERARSDRGKALATLNRLVGRAIQTQDADSTQRTTGQTSPHTSHDSEGES
ncbi:MAG: TolC family protein [Phycisphaerales bacterium]|nr:TolC family protein [Phycisphaerales bacterium]